MRTYAQELASVVQQELLPRLKRLGVTIDGSPITHEDMAFLVHAKLRGELSHRQIRTIMDAMCDPEFPTFVSKMETSDHEQ